MNDIKKISMMQDSNDSDLHIISERKKKG